MYTLHLVRTTIQQDRAETIHNLEPCLTAPVIVSKSRLESRIRDFQSPSFRLEVLTLNYEVCMCLKNTLLTTLYIYLKTEEMTLNFTASNTDTTLLVHPDEHSSNGPRRLYDRSKTLVLQRTTAQVCT